MGAIFRFRSLQPKAWISLLAMLMVLTFTALSTATESTPAGNQIDGYAVVLEGETLFQVRSGIPGVATAQERAEVINRRLVQIANDAAISSDQIRAVEQGDRSVIVAGEQVLLTIGDDERSGSQSRQETSAQIAQKMQAAIERYRDARSVERVTRGVLLGVGSTIALLIFLLAVQRLSSRILIKIRAARRADRLDWRLQNVQVLGSEATSYLLTGLCKLLRLSLVLGALYLYVPFLLSQFPATRSLGNSLFEDVAARVDRLLSTFVEHLPNFGVIALIALLTHYLMQFAKLVIIELGRDDAYPWFYPEWVRPTIRLATMLLIAIACVVAAPYLPGFGSPAFQGISLFLGALLTLGSSSAISNAISGIIIIYTRAFRIGDVIRIQEVIGEVIEKSLFVTRILTLKKETITIPNSSVLNSNIINYSATMREEHGYLILHTTVTLGYDLSWRKVHEVLIGAATATPHICAEPAPFVLQTALNDFNVSYELNAYTDRPDLQPEIYSALHQTIQDCCNQAGIEILSPAFSALRDGNHSTMPPEYLPENYAPPSFHVSSPSQRQ